MKKILFLLMSLVVFISFNVSVKADEFEDQLTQEEENYLYEAGFTKEDVLDLTVEVARELVRGKGEIIDSVFVELPARNINSLGDMIAPTATIPSTDLTINTPHIVKLTSDLVGYKKFIISSGFEWKSQPVWALTDKLAIGFPSSLGVLFNSSGGNILGHSNRYYLLNTTTNVRTYSPIQTIPSDFDPSGGVVGSFDLLLPGSAQTNMRHNGLISQIFYVRSTNSGKATLKLEYGHRKISGSVSVSVTTGGIGITPSAQTDTKYYAVTFDY